MKAAHMRRLALPLAISVSAVAATAHSAPLTFSNRPLGYTVVDQSLHDLLADIGVKLNVHVNVSDAIQGTVHGKQPALPAAAFLNRLGRIYGFSWYYDGTTLYFFADSEVTSRFVDLGNISPVALNDALSDLGIADPRWPIRSSPAAGLAVVQGPPRYIELVQQTLAALQHHESPAVAGPSAVSVFRGNA